MIESRAEARRVFMNVWRKVSGGERLEPLEAIIADVIRQHPEYHGLLGSEASVDADFDADDGSVNPFLHMGMHVALHEQLQADRPAGVRALYQQLMASAAVPHDSEHRMLDCLGQVLWEAQRAGTMPDETRYLDCLRGLSGR